MISPHIKWDHSEDSFVMKFENEAATKSGERKVTISLSDLDYDYIVGHTIDGENNYFIYLRHLLIFLICQDVSYFLQLHIYFLFGKLWL